MVQVSFPFIPHVFFFFLDMCSLFGQHNSNVIWCATLKWLYLVDMDTHIFFVWWCWWYNCDSSSMWWWRREWLWFVGKEIFGVLYFEPFVGGVEECIDHLGSSLDRDNDTYHVLALENSNT